MATFTKGFVATPVKDAMLALEAVQGALNRLIVEERRIEFPETRHYREEVRARFKAVDLNFDPSTAGARLLFCFKGQVRTLSMYFYCDCDHVSQTPNSLSFLMGCSGESELFITTAVHALSVFGKGFVCSCDATDEGYLPVKEQPLTVMDLAVLKYISALSLPRWHTHALNAFPEQAARERFLGIPEQDFLAIRDDYTAAKAFLATQRGPVLSFQEDFQQRLALSV